jgi:phosphopantetheinyl transferase (holo-ACP synthase)
MIGNDIVDLKEAKHFSNWQRPGFLAKLFTTIEQEAILKSKHPALSVWRFWSMKEAAYKLYTQLYQGRFYNPRAFECSVVGPRGVVNYKEFACTLRTQITSDYVLSEARLSDKALMSKVVVLNARDCKAQSMELKEKMISQVREFRNTGDNIAINYNNLGVPALLINNKMHPISLTHHGRFGAFVMA